MNEWEKIEEIIHSRCANGETMTPLEKLSAALDVRDTWGNKLREILSESNGTPRWLNRIREEMDAVAKHHPEHPLASIAAEWSAKIQSHFLPDRKSCPCNFTNPCSKNCSCSNENLSGGCRRCCKYGSLEQRKAGAEIIAQRLNLTKHPQS